MRNFILRIFALALISTAVQAETNEHGEWSFSLLFGGHAPSLEALNNGVLNAPIRGNGGLFTNEITETEERREFNFDNKLPMESYGGKAAFELQWHANSSHSLILGVASWEENTVANMIGEIPTQGVMNTVDFERRAKLSYAEYSIGWRYAFLKRKKYNLYLRTSFHEVFDIDYREEFIFSYLSGSDLAGFSRIQILEAQTASLFMGNFSLGGEWFFLKWLAVGFEAGYLFGERSVQLRDATLKTDFIARDNIDFTALPYAVLDDGTLGHVSASSDADSPTYERMKISFSGWQLLLRMNIYY